MDGPARDRVLEIWEEFADPGYVYVNDEGERRKYADRKRQREDRVPVIRGYIDAFLSSDTDLLTFRKELDSESKNHTQWGFGGTSQMFFNMLCNTATRQDRIGEVGDHLRSLIPPPASEGEAGGKIRELVTLVEDLKANADNKQKAPQAGYVPAFLSFFWHIRETDRIPIYYQSSRSAYRNLGIWSPVDDLDDSYVTFWETTDEIRDVVEEHTGESPHLWQVEFAVLNYDTKPHGPIDDDGADTVDAPETEERVETYAEFERRAKGVADDFAVDVPGLYFPELDELLRRIQTSLQIGKHVLLIGPPGTGKTKLAKQICRSAVGEDFKMATATSDWSTFDTIGGYQPDRREELVFKPGVFLDRFQDPEGRPVNEWLIVDEINRADIDKAFGSLFTALTGEDVTLPFVDDQDRSIEVLGSQESRDRSIESNRYYVPSGWRMLATMNTFDKTSLYEMSYAFMRRWAFVHVPVPEEVDGDLVEQYVHVWDGLKVDDERCAAVARLWQSVNESREIGPAIVEDVYRYLSSTSDVDFASPIALYVVPQLEGLRDDELVQFVDRTSAETPASRDKLVEFVSDFFGVPEGKFGR